MQVARGCCNSISSVSLVCLIVLPQTGIDTGTTVRLNRLTRKIAEGCLRPSERQVATKGKGARLTRDVFMTG